MIRYRPHRSSLACLWLPLLACCASPPSPSGAVLQTSAETTSASATPNPAWVNKLITELKAQPLANPPASIFSYEYAGATVYYLPPKCCDFPSLLLDADGKKLCSPDGGLTGRGDGQCADFRSQRRSEHLIWKDPREREPRP